jgi:tetrahydromethanopterin:alpha-L-glutamate ligase
VLQVAHRILVINESPGKRSLKLSAALRRHGCRASTVALSSIRFDTDRPFGLSVPGLDEELPDAVIVRSIAKGSFEAITRRLGVLHVFGRLGIPVWNSARAIERCVDKSMTTFLLKNAGLPTPATFAVEGLAAAREVAARELGKGGLVLKPLFGAQGRGIRLIKKPEDLPVSEEVGDVYYLQRYVSRPGPPFYDFRVLVCAGKVLAMMSRRGDDWVTNINRGALPERVSGVGEAELGRLAIAAADAVGADFAGIDIVADAEGRLYILEVNGMPAWSGLQQVAEVSIANEIASALLASLDARERGRSSLPRIAAAAG